jgi:hypothetical protein
MAQGHFPLRADTKGVLKLAPSPDLAELVRPDGSAVARLSGQTLSVCQRLISQAASQAAAQ